MNAYAPSSRQLANAPRMLRGISTRSSRALSLTHRRTQLPQGHRRARFQSTDPHPPSSSSVPPQPVPASSSSDNAVTVNSQDPVSVPTPDLMSPSGLSAFIETKTDLHQLPPSYLADITSGIRPRRVLFGPSRHKKAHDGAGTAGSLSSPSLTTGPPLATPDASYPTPSPSIPRSNVMKALEGRLTMDELAIIAGRRNRPRTFQILSRNKRLKLSETVRKLNRGDYVLEEELDDYVKHLKEGAVTPPLDMQRKINQELDGAMGKQPHPNQGVKDLELPELMSCGKDELESLLENISHWPKPMGRSHSRPVQEVEQQIEKDKPQESEDPAPVSTSKVWSDGSSETPTLGSALKKMDEMEKRFERLSAMVMAQIELSSPALARKHPALEVKEGTIREPQKAASAITGASPETQESDGTYILEEQTGENIQGRGRPRYSNGVVGGRKRKEWKPPPLAKHKKYEVMKVARGVLEPDKIKQLLEDVQPPTEQLPIARLAHGLDRVLFNSGVHWLQCPRSRVYNFTPYLQKIPPVNDFSFSHLKHFTPPSQDTDIRELLERHDKQFSGSTSSLTGILSHIFFLISGEKSTNTLMLSGNFIGESRQFTPGQRMPSTVVFNKIGGGEAGSTGKPRYCIDSGYNPDSDPEKNILTWMGTMLEKLLTLPKEEFERFLKSKEDAPFPEKSDKREAFRYSKSDNFIMRSQLDCHDPRLPGSGVFDIKTRACAGIRYDIYNWQENSGYLIRTQLGKTESFEREYYDLMRSGFLKYQFQARIGGMDGVIVAFHNTVQMFGFQYIPLEEMDECLFGPQATGIGDRVFKACVKLMEHISEEVVQCFPDHSVRATFETVEYSNQLNIFVEPLNWQGKGEWPMKQLQVRTTVTCDDMPMKVPWDAFREIGYAWRVPYAIARLSRGTEEVRARLEQSKGRAKRAWCVPTGVDLDDLKEWYDNLNFGGEVRNSKESSFSEDKFSPKVNSRTMSWRRSARAGRRDTERWQKEQAGKPVHVLGQEA